MEEDYEVIVIDLISVPAPIRRTKKYVEIAALKEDKAIRKKFLDWKTARHNQRKILTNINRQDSPFNFKVFTRLYREGDNVFLFIWKKNK